MSAPHYERQPTIPRGPAPATARVLESRWLLLFCEPSNEDLLVRRRRWRTCFLLHLIDEFAEALTFHGGMEQMIDAAAGFPYGASLEDLDGDERASVLAELGLSDEYERPGLGPFLRTLDHRLGSCSVEQTRAALLEHGKRLTPDKREAFLSIFPAPGAESPTDRAADSGEELLVDTDNFVNRLASGVYYQDWGWDDDLDDTP